MKRIRLLSHVCAVLGLVSAVLLTAWVVAHPSAPDERPRLSAEAQPDRP